MNPVLALGLVIAAGIAVTRVPRLVPTPPAFDLVRNAGTTLVVLGIVLGPGIGVLDEATLRAVAPVGALAVGWIGAAFGARLDRRLFQRLQPHIMQLALVQAATAFAVVGAGFWLLTTVVPALAAAWAPRLPAGLALAAVAAASGPGMIGLLTEGTSTRWSLVSTVGLTAVLDTGLGVVAFILTLALAHPRVPGAGFGWVTWLLLASGSGVLVGLLFLSFTRVRHTAHDLALSLFGCLLLGAGVGYAAGLTPFVVCAVAGALIASLSSHRRAALALLEEWERPATGVLLVAAGALLRLPTPWIVPAVVVLAAARIAARWTAVRFARGPIGAADLPPDIGLVGTAQGAVAVALGVSFHLVFGGAVLTAVVLSVALAQLAAPVTLSRGLRPAPLTPATPAPEVTA
ncbi:MAG: hypothetical protein HYS40_02370 [Gemmatimonadetes bacterium]|nr:hypothetical protein [Gemmatimonadota bacterium]